MKYLFQKIGDVISTLLLGRLKELIIRTDEKVKRIDKDFDDLKKDIKSIDRRVGRIEGKLGLGPIAGDSPLHLTEIGKKILNESGIKKLVDKKKEELLNELKKKNFTHPYDIQEWCFKKFDELSEKPELQELFKDYAFKKGYSVSEIFEIGAIYFRDIALKELGFSLNNLKE